MRPLILVYGSTGRAGRQVAERLIASGYSVIVGGQERAKVDRVSQELRVDGRVASVKEPLGLSAVLRGVTVVVNCAGPFFYTADPLVRQCLASRVHYLDISGERGSVRTLASHDRAAREHGVTIVPAAGAKGALGAWARALAVRGEPSAALDIAYAHGGAAYWRPTPAALLSLAREALEFQDMSSKEYGPPPRLFDFPRPFGRGLAVHVAGTDDVPLPGEPEQTRVRTYLSVDPGRPDNIGWGVIHHPLLVGNLRPLALNVWRALLAAGPAELGRRLPPPGDAALALVVESVGSGASRPKVAISAADGYRASAATAERCLEALLESSRRGVLSPATLVPARAALGGLSRQGVLQVFTDGRSPRLTRAPAAR